MLVTRLARLTNGVILNVEVCHAEIDFHRRDDAAVLDLRPDVPFSEITRIGVGPKPSPVIDTSTPADALEANALTKIADAATVCMNDRVRVRDVKFSPPVEFR